VIVLDSGLLFGGHPVGLYVSPSSQLGAVTRRARAVKPAAAN